MTTRTKKRILGSQAATKRNMPVVQKAVTSTRRPSAADRVVMTSVAKNLEALRVLARED